MIFLYDISSLEWSSKEENDLNIFSFGFTDGDRKLIEFDNLKYGIEVLEDGSSLFNESFPLIGETIISTDQEFIEQVALNSVADSEYSFIFWAENAGVKKDSSFSFIAPVPASPYNSWTWDDEVKMWHPPVPMPEEDAYWIWDEATLSWVKSTEFE
jgi:hypothetical protein